MSAKDLILSLEEVKERQSSSYVSPFNKEDLRLRDPRSEAEEDWEAKLADECNDEYNH